MSLALTIKSEDGEVIEEEIITGKDIESLQELEDSLLPAVIHPEANFLRLPLFSLSWRGLKNKTKTEYRCIEERDGKKVELLWQVTANAEYGYPTPFDHKVARAVDALINQSILKNGYPLENPIPFSIYKLARLTDHGSDSASLYANIRESIERIIATTIKSEGSFFLKDEKRWLGKVFHIYESAIFMGREMPDGSVADSNYLWLGREYLRNINAQYTRPLDYKYLTGLKSELASRLYELLSGKFYGLPEKEDYLRISYSNLCQTLPLTEQRYYSKAREKLDPAHEELIKTGYLSRVIYQRYKRRKSFNIKYYLGERARREKNGHFSKGSTQEEQLLLPLVDNVAEAGNGLSHLAQELHQMGLSKSAATQFAQIHSEGHIREKIEMFELLRASDSELISKNPAGWLRKAIEEDWQPTEDQKRSKVVEAQKSEEQERQARWIEHRRTLIEQELSIWDDTPADERIQGRLDFWIAGQKINRGGPTESEIENERQELIDNLPKTDEEKREYITRNYTDHPPEDFE